MNLVVFDVRERHFLAFNFNPEKCFTSPLILLLLKHTITELRKRLPHAYRKINVIDICNFISQ